MPAVEALPLVAGQVAQSAAIDNATATANVPGATGVRHLCLGLHADYSGAPSAGFKTITLKKATTTIMVFRHDFTLGAFLIPMPVAVGGDYGQALSAELQASGVGGTTGRVSLFYISN